MATTNVTANTQVRSQKNLAVGRCTVLLSVQSRELASEYHTLLFGHLPRQRYTWAPEASMADQTQSYKNHARFLPPYHFFVMPVLLLNVLNTGRHLFQQATVHNLWEVVFALGLLGLGLFSRVQALTVQDRVIRLEERLRLRQLLPADLHPHI